MGTRDVRLDEEVYERIEVHEPVDRTVSDVIGSLTGDCLLLEFAVDYTADRLAHFP